MSTITGFNPEQAKKDIENFKDYSYIHIESPLANTISNLLFSNLQNYWCSPKAVEFYKLYEPKCVNVLNEVTDTRKKIILNSWSAYNRLATANGLYSSYNNELDDYRVPTNWQINCELKEESPYGVVGMNKVQVRALINDVEEKIKTIIEALDNAPSSIAFYDDGGELQAAFQNMIKTAGAHISELITEITTALKTAMEEEIDKIELAKNSAVETMTA